MDEKMNKERFLDNLFKLIKIDSPSLEEKDMSDYLISHFEERGEKVFVDDSGKEFGSNGQNVLVYIPGTLGGLESICFNAHQDTVSPGRNIVPVIEGNKIKSSGDTILGGDDKAGIAMLIEAYEYLKENDIPHRDMYFLFTLSEEIMQGARHYDTSNIKSKYIFVLDGAGHPKYLVSASKGKTVLEYEFIGKSAHAGVDIGQGKNAVVMAARAISKMENGEIDGDTTVNISSIHGGKDTPTVPDKAVVIIELRSFDQEKIDRQVSLMNEIAIESAKFLGGDVSITTDILSPPYIGKPDEYLYQRTKKAIINEGLEPVEVRTSGSSDANIFGGKGYICGGLGVGMYNVHTTEEYINIEEIKMAYRIMLDIMTN